MSQPNSPDGPSDDQQGTSAPGGAGPAGGIGAGGLGSGPGLPDMGGMGEMGDMSGMLAQVQQMQQQVMQAQQELSEATFEGTAGGDLVTATVSGTGELAGLEIKPEACDPTDTETLADLVLAAVRDATAKQQDEAAEKLGPLAGGMGL